MSDIDQLMDNAAAQCSRHECEAAIRALESAAQLAPQEWKVQYHLGLCFAGGCLLHPLVDPDVALYHLQNALSLLPGSAKIEDRASVLSTLGNTYLASHQLPVKARVGAALECQRQASAMYQSQGDLDHWAREEYNLGNTWCECPQKSSPDKWQHAVQHYTAALQVWTRDQDAKRYAKVLQNLGTAYRELKTGDRRENICRALRCYRRALQISNQEFRTGSPSIHNNIGTALLSVSADDPRRNIRRALAALRHFELALRTLDEEASPRIYAFAQFNCGQALLRLASLGENPRLHLERALRLFTESRDWFLLHSQAALAESARECLQEVMALSSKFNAAEP
ncbi:MAG: hypothetical protein ROO76_03175 [Terriglobia bacterium]|jgi:tetratricopeptide (TPR) repeat protein|nr:hypothetical protein [Terriglobia bacterium]